MSPEFRPIATLIFQTKTNYGTTINARIISTDDGDPYIDWRDKTISRTTVSTTDHSLLTNLGSDDHLQYILTDGSRAFTGGMQPYQTSDDSTMGNNTLYYSTSTNKLSYKDPNGIIHQLY